MAFHFFFQFKKKAAGFVFIPKIIQAISLIHYYFTRINNDAKGFNHTKEASHTVKKNRHI